MKDNKVKFEDISSGTDSGVAGWSPASDLEITKKDFKKEFLSGRLLAFFTFQNKFDICANSFSLCCGLAVGFFRFINENINTIFQVVSFTDKIFFSRKIYY